MVFVAVGARCSQKRLCMNWNIRMSSPGPVFRQTKCLSSSPPHSSMKSLAAVTPTSPRENIFSVQKITVWIEGCDDLYVWCRYVWWWRPCRAWPRCPGSPARTTPPSTSTTSPPPPSSAGAESTEGRDILCPKNIWFVLKNISSILISHLNAGAESTEGRKTSQSCQNVKTVPDRTEWDYFLVPTSHILQQLPIHAYTFRLNQNAKSSEFLMEGSN